MRNFTQLGNRSRSPPSTELCRSRRSANDGSIAGRSQLVSFDHLVGASEQRERGLNPKRLGVIRRAIWTPIDTYSTSTRAL